MKKIKIIVFILFAIVFVLTILSFIKLPINILTEQRIQNETNGLISLKSSEKQSLLLLPMPKIEALNSVFSINNNFFDADISIPNIKLSRSLLNEDGFSIQVQKANIENIKSNFLNNITLLEGEIENLNFKITNSNDLIEIKSNVFKYKNADIFFNAFIRNNSLEKISFSIDRLDIDELILLLDEKYQKYLKKISFSNLSLKGELINNNLILEKLEINLRDESRINLLGMINIQNLFNSDLKISGSEITSENIKQFFDNFNLNYDLKDIPKGFLKTFDFDYQGGSFKNASFEYQSNLDTILLVNGEINWQNILESDLNFELNTSSPEEISALSKPIQALNSLSSFKFEQLNLSASLSKGLLNINSLNTFDGDSNVNISGDVDLYDLEKRSLKIVFNNFNQFDSIPFPNEINEFFAKFEFDNINLNCILYNSDLKIINSDILLNDNSLFSMAGDVNLQNIEDAILDIDFQNVKIKHIEEILKFIDQTDYLNFFEIIDFDEIKGSAILNLKKRSTVINGLELIKNENITSNLSGEIFNNKFKGLISSEKIDLSKIDKNFFKTDRIKGFVNVDLEIPNWISPSNIIGISGNIEGDISIEISDDEFALLVFMQSLSNDIEDFQQVNQLLGKLSKSFIKKRLSLNGKIKNETKNMILIKDLTLIASDGNSLVGNLEYQGKNFKILIYDIINEEDLIIKFDNGSYSFERISADGLVKKPIEELIQKNINKLFENLLQ